MDIQMREPGSILKPDPWRVPNGPRSVGILQAANREHSKEAPATRITSRAKAGTDFYLADGTSNHAISSNDEIASLDEFNICAVVLGCLADAANATATYGDISSWGVSRVTDMSYQFYQVSTFNGDISLWNVSGVTHMSYLFDSAALFNGDISFWGVSGVVDMIYMFNRAASFNGDISLRNVSAVRYMSFAFSVTASFIGDISAWGVSGVLDMRGMFCEAASSNGDMSSWDVSNVADMSIMFYGTTSFNGDLSSWNTSSVTDITCMFYAASSYYGVSALGAFRLSKVCVACSVRWLCLTATLVRGAFLVSQI
jgi:surface protein